MSEEFTWIDRARKQVEYHAEALDFVRRVGEQLPTTVDDAAQVSRLWVEADILDQMLCSLLDEMNSGLVDGGAEFDSTRGAAIHDTELGEQELRFECSWSLSWSDLKGIAVTLAINPRVGVFTARVSSVESHQLRDIAYPVIEDALKEVLISVYVAEETKGTY